MKKKFKQYIHLLIISILLFTFLISPISATDQNDPNYNYAVKLKELGVFVGTDNGFELSRIPTRIEGIVLLIRLLGKESEALTLKNNPTTFTDVPDWARGYVNYAKAHNLTNGISATLFGSQDNMTVEQYVTFLLRSLGYSDSKGDFVWNESLTKAKTIGMISSTSTYASTTFIRSQVAKLSYDALLTLYKNSNNTLAKYLVNLGAIDESIAVAIGIIPNPAFINGKLYALKDNSFYDLGENDCYVDVVASASIQGSKKEDVYIHSGEENKDSHSLLILPISGYSKLVIRVVQENTTANNQLALLPGRINSIATAKTTTPYKTYPITDTSTFISIDLTQFNQSDFTFYIHGLSNGNIFIYNLYLE